MAIVSLIVSLRITYAVLEHSRIHVGFKRFMCC